MDRVEKLRIAREDYTVKFIEFTRIYRRNNDQLICLCEGEDDKYYRIRIERALECPFDFIRCGGKRAVLELRQLIAKNNDYKDAIIGYFVDKDFDVSIPTKERKYVYETPCYSIENLYTADNSFSAILKSEFKLSPYSDKSEEYEKCFGLFKERFREFHSKIAFLNGWIILQRKNEAVTGVRKLHLSNYNLDKFAIINLNKVDSLYDLDKLKEYFPDSYNVLEDEVSAILQSIAPEEFRNVFRGKYEIQFLRIFIAKLRDDANNVTPLFFQSRRNIPLNLSQKNILSELSQYAITPPCLEEYLKNLNELIKSKKLLKNTNKFSALFLKYIKKLITWRKSK